VSGGPTVAGVITRRNVVLSATYIGIQCSNFLNWICTENQVSGCLNNGIDGYGQNSGGTTANDFVIANNIIYQTLNGIFPDTCGHGVVTGNTIINSGTGAGSYHDGFGIFVNFQYEMGACVVSNNNIDTCEYGVGSNGQPGDGLVVQGNVISNYYGGGVGLGTQGPFSYGTVQNNYFRPSSAGIPAVLLGSNTVNYVKGKNNVVFVPGGATAASLTSITAGTYSECAVDSYMSLPYQVGPDLQSRYLALTVQRTTVSGSTTVTVNPTVGSFLDITVTTTTGFSIGQPSTASDGAFLKIRISNQAGGALGAITWNSAFKMQSFTSPASTFNTTLEFQYLASEGFWYQTAASAATVPN
jgi:hypothetical protein